MSMTTTHECLYGLELHACDDSACTLTHLAGFLSLLSQFFREDADQHRDYVVLPDADAQQLASVIAAIRELVWHYREYADWHAMLDLLDLLQELLHSQYRTAAGTFELSDMGTAAFMTILDLVCTTLHRWAEQAEETPTD